MVIVIDDSMEGLFQTHIEEHKFILCHNLHTIATTCLRGEHWIVCANKICETISALDCIDAFSRAIFDKIRHQFSIRSAIIEHVSLYCRITFFDETKDYNNPYFENGLIMFDLRCPYLDKILQKTLMLCEDINDSRLYRIIALKHIRDRKIKINIDYEIRNGGGQNTASVFELIACDENRFCICLFDSDFSYANATDYGEVGKQIKNAYLRMKKSTQSFKCFNVRAIENVMPLNTVEAVIIEYKMERAAETLKELIQKCGIEVLNYYNFKKGIIWNHVVSDTSAKSIYWRKVLAAMGFDIEELKAKYGIDEANYKINLVPGISEKVAFLCIEYMESQGERLFNNITIEDRLIREWNDMGAYITDWCCSFEKLRIY